MLQVAFLRSSHAHAVIKKIDATEARQCEGVVAVLASDDWPEFATTMPNLAEPGTHNNRYCDYNWAPLQPLMSRRARYGGEQIAVIIAENSYAAADALACIDVDYEPLPVIADWQAGFADRAPRVHSEHSNIVAHLKFEMGDLKAAFEDADIVFEERLETQSLKSMAIECRACAASWDRTTNTLNVWSTTQLPYLLRKSIAQMLALPAENVRVMGRDVGGSFGLKGALYPEDMIVPLIAYKLGRPVRWAETRSEHMVASNHSGTQVHEVRVAANRDGTIRGMDLKIYKDVGSYNHFEMVLPTNTINHLPTHYKIPALRAEGWAIATNTSPGSPFRGAGRVEASFVMDRVLDAVAKKTGIDPLELRLRNIIRPEEMPYANGLVYRDGVPVRYDGGDFPRLLQLAAERLDYKGWRAKQAELRKAGRAIGLGISSYIEAGGIGPCEGATVRIDDHGRVSVKIGVNSQGQSHETTFAQVCAQTLGARFEDVTVYSGDTSLQPYGFGTGASRVGVNAGNAVFKAATTLRAKVTAVAANALGCDVQNMVLVDGVAYELGARQNFLAFSELEKLSYKTPNLTGGAPGLIATDYFYPETVTWSAGCNMVVLEVDLDNGDLKILKYVFAHDCGTPLNIAVVDGQIYGGFAQGFGIALGEKLKVDERGQVTSGSLMDYYVARAIDVPEIEIIHTVTPTTRNPLGMRSVGESGPNSPPAALASAIEDAIGDVRITSLPVDIRGLISQKLSRASVSV